VNKTPEIIGHMAMGYKTGSQVEPSIFAAEGELLRAGFSYTEIAAKTGQKVKTISERNRLIHKVDIWEAFQRRIERDGMPNRLSVPDSFGYWFSGFFDGEGTITVFTRPCTARPQYSEFRLSIRIMIRDDDAEILTRVQDNLKVGSISRHGQKGTTNPAIAWVCERVQDLAEVVVPLFDRYPLHSKKRDEYAIWKPLVMQRYVTTLAGYSNRRGIPDDQRAAFHQGIEAIRDIRRYRPASERITEIDENSAIIA
jgi:hypothetical protein